MDFPRLHRIATKNGRADDIVEVRLPGIEQQLEHAERLSHARGEFVGYTNSEAVILRIQRAVRKQVLAAADVAIWFWDTDDEPTQLRLDSSGTFADPFPGNFWWWRQHEAFD